MTSIFLLLSQGKIQIDNSSQAKRILHRSMVFVETDQIFSGRSAIRTSCTMCREKKGIFKCPKIFLVSGDVVRGILCV